MVSREEIHRELWPPDTFVDFDQSLGTALRKLRQALCDDAETPRYIETIPKQGLRFVAPVERISAEPQGAEAVLPVRASELPAPEIERKPQTTRRAPSPWWAVLAAVFALVTAALVYWRSSPGQPVVEGATQLTDDDNPKLLNSPVVSDGSRIYFGELRGSSEVLAQVAATGGQTGTIASGIQAPVAGRSGSRLFEPSGLCP